MKWSLFGLHNALQTLNFQGPWCSDFLQSLMLVPYIYDIVLMQPGKQEGPSTLGALVSSRK